MDDDMEFRRIARSALRQDNEPEWYLRFGLSAEDAAKIAASLREQAVGWGNMLYRLSAEDQDGEVHMADDLKTRFSAEFKPAAERYDQIAFSATWLDWWSLLGAVQLALRHPDFNGLTRVIAEQMARGIQAELAPDGALAEVAEMGWHAEYDAPSGWEED